ncbi:precorrin-6A synthase (deacetylating), partial [Nocardia sp. NPDC057353]|uniref:precorrin-6A synthase (deacetylating) n=1 Tax=Nocardia sp. NPDC057353 TaxID=3346104 RepID=UPI003631FC34
MRTLHVIGIGAGHPDQVTLQAVAAIGQVDTFFVIGKGEDKRELLALRATILDRHAKPGHRVVEVQDPPRDRDPGDYRGAVEDWHRRRAALLAAEFAAVDGVGGILVWGDPSLYDSTLRLVETIRAGQDFEYTVIPGVTSPQALAAAHRTVLHGIGEPVHITTGRRLRAEGLGNDPTLVMLDGDCAWSTLPPDGVHIWWGAYLGMPDEELIEGPLIDVGPRIAAPRAELRPAQGGVMDVNQRPPAPPVPPLV